LINNYTKNLELNEIGIYTTQQNIDISYPVDGNNRCFEIEDNSFWFEHRNKVILAVIKKYIEGNVFIDIGGGNGYVSSFLQNNGINTILLEPGQQGALNAKKRGLENVICSTLEDVKFVKETVPNIGLFDVIEHIEDDIKFLNKVNEILLPNGRLFITIPALKFLWSENDTRAGHFRRYTLKSIKDTLQAANFKINYSTYFFSMLPLPIFIKRTLPSLININSKDKYQQSKQEHSEKSGLIAKCLNSFANKEIRKIDNCEIINIGSSIVVVATKN